MFIGRNFVNMMKRIIGLGLIIIGGIGILSAVTKDNSDSSKQLQDKHNLALRQVVHQLYLIAGDRSSKIFPVNKIDDNTFQVKVDKALKYDTLPYLIDKAISDFNLDNNYYVIISNCDTEEVMLGFNHLSLQNQVIACQDREHNINCSYLNITFPQKNTSKLLQTIGFGLVSLLGLMLLLIALRKKTKRLDQPMEKKQEIEKEKEVIRYAEIGEFKFDYQNLLLIYGDQSTTLTFRENKLLNLLSQNTNQILEF